MFKKILIANRGEIALRVIRACRELGIATVAVHSTADADALHVRFADEAVCIGPPPARQSYLNIPAIITAAEITGADAIHPGYGFLSENAEFAEVCEQLRHALHRPAARGDAAHGRQGRGPRGHGEGRPAAPARRPGVLARRDARPRSWPSEIGFPVILKAAAGGGGRGMKIVPRAAPRSRQAFDTASAEALAAFGNGSMYLERYVEQPRHIEFQILADEHGNVLHLGERECSVQRRHQKLIEEAPSPALTPSSAPRDGRGRASGPCARSATTTSARSSSCSTSTAASTSWR